MNAKQEETKQYLEQLSSCDLLINQAKQELDRLRKIANYANSVSIAKIKELKTVDPETRFTDYQSNLMQEIKQLTAHKDLFQQITDEKLVAVIHYRYIDCLKWDDVAYEMGYCRRTIHQLHNIALDAVADILNADKSAA